MPPTVPVESGLYREQIALMILILIEKKTFWY